MKPAPFTSTPFHTGEQAMQQRLGVKVRMENFGRKVVRPFMPDQHRNFFAKLPLVVLGAVDAEGWPWATFLFGRPGFLSSPDPTHLHIGAKSLVHDPIQDALTMGRPVGLLGIELSTRRRNRMNGRIVTSNAFGFSVEVQHSFGNCAMYIQTRSLDFARDPQASFEPAVERLDRLDDEARQTITQANTFFVASYVSDDGDKSRHGVDVSHRGGQPGFVHIDPQDTLTIPDFSGNLHFNTLGNLYLNPKAGLLFPDFITGDLLYLVGTTELDFDPNHAAAYAKAERLWRFHPQRGVRLKKASPLLGKLETYSPKLSGTGPWKGSVL